MSNVMQNILFNPSLDDAARRKALFAGNLIVLGATPASRALCQHAINMAKEAFDPLDPEHAQESLEVQKFIEIVGPLKSRFTNDMRTKELVRAYLEEQGVDTNVTYFDVPRLRVVPHSGYLTAGVSYAYKAHRDTWYSSPHGQINWWLPVHEVVPERAMSFYPTYWDRKVPNSSGDFDYDEWTRVGHQGHPQTSDSAYRPTSFGGNAHRRTEWRRYRVLRRAPTCHRAEFFERNPFQYGFPHDSRRRPRQGRGRPQRRL
jgi:hypothetical protein